MENTPQYEKENYERKKNTKEYQMKIQMTKRLYPIIYKADNNFAYNIDTNNQFKIFNNTKILNFVPTYDNWCLYCDARDCEKKCSKCKSVFFCNTTCQKKAWKIHKKHCGRNLFGQCITCGKETNNQNTHFKCPHCPVKFCSEKCKKEIYKAHKDFDCDYFAKTFGVHYLEYN